LVVGASPISQELQHFVEAFVQRPVDDFSEEFRLWIVAEDRDIPPSIANSCVNVILEAPEGVKHNVVSTLNAWGAFATDGATTRAKVCLALFHAIAQERRAYIPQGWSRWYAWEWGEVCACARALEGGGRSGRALAYISAFETLPNIDPPQLLGLPENCRVAWERNTATDIINGLKEFDSTVIEVNKTSKNNVTPLKMVLALWKKLMASSALIKGDYEPTNIKTSGAGWWCSVCLCEVAAAARISRGIHRTLARRARARSAPALHQTPEEWQCWWAGPATCLAYLHEFCPRALAAEARINSPNLEVMPTELDLRSFLRPERVIWAVRARAAERYGCSVHALALHTRWGAGAGAGAEEAGGGALVVRGLQLAGAAWAGDAALAAPRAAAPPRAPAPPLLLQYAPRRSVTCAGGGRARGAGGHGGGAGVCGRGARRGAVRGACAAGAPPRRRHGAAARARAAAALRLGTGDFSCWRWSGTLEPEGTVEVPAYADEERDVELFVAPGGHGGGAGVRGRGARRGAVRGACAAGAPPRRRHGAAARARAAAALRLGTGDFSCWRWSGTLEPEGTVEVPAYADEERDVELHRRLQLLAVVWDIRAGGHGGGAGVRGRGARRGAVRGACAAGAPPRRRHGAAARAPRCCCPPPRHRRLQLLAVVWDIRAGGHGGGAGVRGRGARRGAVRGACAAGAPPRRRHGAAARARAAAALRLGTGRLQLLAVVWDIRAGGHGGGAGVRGRGARRGAVRGACAAGAPPRRRHGAAARARAAAALRLGTGDFSCWRWSGTLEPEGTVEVPAYADEERDVELFVAPGGHGGGAGVRGRGARRGAVRGACAAGAPPRRRHGAAARARAAAALRLGTGDFSCWRWSGTLEPEGTVEVPAYADEERDVELRRARWRCRRTRTRSATWSCSWRVRRWRATSTPTRRGCTRPRCCCPPPRHRRLQLLAVVWDIRAGGHGGGAGVRGRGARRGAVRGACAAGAPPRRRHGAAARARAAAALRLGTGDFSCWRWSGTLEPEGTVEVPAYADEERDVELFVARAPLARHLDADTARLHAPALLLPSA
ncbi:hypothetical protein ACJJTC_011189, partial [Scirpophaga incertulas]